VSEVRYPTGRLPSRPGETVLEWLERTDKELSGEQPVQTHYLVYTSAHHEGGEIFGVFSSMKFVEAAFRAEYEGSDESEYRAWRDTWTVLPITIDVPFRETV
jgi:hypothetical protein